MAKVVFKTPCAFVATSAGFGDFVVASAVAGFDVPENLNVIDGKVYVWYAQTPDGEIWMRGRGAYTIASHTLARTTIEDNSDGTTDQIDFPVPPEVSVMPSMSTTLDAAAVFASGTRIVFQQTNAPLGWTKDTTKNDHSLRVVSGSAGTGGSVNFSTLFGLTQVGSFTLSTTEMPSHGHSFAANQFDFQGAVAAAGGSGLTTANTNNTGGGASHTHSMDMRVKFADVIIAQKD